MTHIDRRDTHELMAGSNVLFNAIRFMQRPLAHLGSHVSGMASVAFSDRENGRTDERYRDLVAVCRLVDHASATVAYQVQCLALDPQNHGAGARLLKSNSWQVDDFILNLNKSLSSLSNAYAAIPLSPFCREYHDEIDERLDTFRKKWAMIKCHNGMGSKPCPNQWRLA